MDDIEYVGRVSSQKMTSIEQDNKAAQTKYRQDMMSAALRRIATKEPQAVELTRERFPEES
jgi:hypothetical protein